MYDYDKYDYMFDGQAPQHIVLLIPPFRLGKKQNRAILDSLGHELVVFPKGREKEAEDYCNYLNEHHKGPSHEEYEKAIDEIGKLQKEIDRLLDYIKILEHDI